jgi:hypothetical protein
VVNVVWMWVVNLSENITLNLLAIIDKTILCFLFSPISLFLYF